MMRLWLVVGTLLATPFSVQAFEVLRGTFEQGGFVVAETLPTTKVMFQGDQIPVGKDGVFVVGFDRQQAQEATAILTHADGRVERHHWQISPRTYDVQHVTGVAPKHVNPDPKQMTWISNDAVKINRARDIFTDVPYFMETFAWPVSASISGVYGSSRTFNGEERSWHKGLDIAAPKGAKVTAPATGVVRLALPNSFFNGNMVVLDHGHQLYTYYAHLNTLAVKNGQKLKTGDLIGTVGATGRATGPHLHWGLYWRKMALDPMLLMTERRATQ